MTTQKKIIYTIILLATVVLCVVGLSLFSLQKVKGLEHLPALSPKTEMELIDYPINRKFVKSEAFEIKTTNENISSNVYHAVAYNQTSHAEWFMSDEIVWKNGRITSKFENSEAIHVAFIAFNLPEGTIVGDTTTYGEIIKKAFAVSSVFFENNFSSDATAPKIYLNAKNPNGETYKEYNISGQRFFVPVTFYFEETGVSSGFRYAILIGYRGDTPEYVLPDRMNGGIHIDPALLAGTGIRKVAISAEDALKNISTISIEIGYAPASSVSYTTEYKPADGSIAESIKQQCRKYFVDPTSLSSINSILEEYKTEYDKLGDEVSLFNASLERFKPLVKFNRDEIHFFSDYLKSTAEIIVACDTALANLTDAGQKNAVVEANTLFVKYKQEYDERRLTDNGFYLNPKGVLGGQKTVVYYQYYLVLEKKVISEGEFLGTIKTTATEVATLAECYSFKIMLEDVDRTIDLQDIPFSVTITLSDNFNNLRPIGGIYKSQTFIQKVSSADKGKLLLDGLVLSPDMLILLAKTELIPIKSTTPILLISCILVFVGIIGILVIFAIIQNRSMTKKINALQEELFKIKKTVRKVI